MMRRNVVAAAAATLLAGCSFLSSATTPSIESTASVSVDSPTVSYPDCELRASVDVVGDELVTVAQTNGYGVTDSVTLSRSTEVVRPAAQGATVSIVAFDAETEAMSTLFRGEISDVHAEECGVSET